jgi:hypothetical protein
MIKAESSIKSWESFDASWKGALHLMHGTATIRE